MFWYWRQRLDESPEAAPEEAVRWHHALRTSGQAWADAFGGCRHASMGEVDEQRSGYGAKVEASRPFVERAVGLVGSSVAAAAEDLEQ